MERNVIKSKILEVLDFLKFQVENDKCTVAELRSINDALIDNMDVDATAKDLADFYHTSEKNVRNIASRTFHTEKPKRKVFYNLKWFRKIIPNAWKH
jgi:galactitol-specific phosphotransferase system IIB component